MLYANAFHNKVKEGSGKGKKKDDSLLRVHDPPPMRKRSASQHCIPQLLLEEAQREALHRKISNSEEDIHNQHALKVPGASTPRRRSSKHRGSVSSESHIVIDAGKLFGGVPPEHQRSPVVIEIKHLPAAALHESMPKIIECLKHLTTESPSPAPPPNIQRRHSRSVQK